MLSRAGGSSHQLAVRCRRRVSVRRRLCDGSLLIRRSSLLVELMSQETFLVLQNSSSNHSDSTAQVYLNKTPKHCQFPGFRLTLNTNYTVESIQTCNDSAGNTTQNNSNTKTQVKQLCLFVCAHTMDQGLYIVWPFSFFFF